MSVIDEKLLLLRTHECAAGLDDDALQEIAEAAELLRLDTGDFLHRANQPVKSVFLIVHGRLKQAVVDLKGNILFHRFLGRGSQFGALGAAQAEPVPIDVIALEPSIALRLDFERALEFTRKFAAFGLNITRSISSMVRQTLMAGQRSKPAPFITVFHQSAASRQLTSLLTRRLRDLGESLSIMHDLNDWEQVEGTHCQSLLVHEQPLSKELVQRQLNLCADSTRVIFDVDAGMEASQAAILVEFSDQVLWCCGEHQIDLSIARLKEIEARVPGWRDKISLVWTLAGDSWVAPTAPELRKLVERDFKVSFSNPGLNQGKQLSDGLERLVHHLRGIRIGLALGGGGAKGMAHIGVLKALEENGIVIDMIAGTSAGAMTGIIHASGFSTNWSANQFAHDLKPGWFFDLLPRGKHWYLLNKYRRHQFDPMLRRYLRDWRLEQLPIPVQSITVDLIAGKPIVRVHGDAVNSILESINLPVISKPICRDGQALVDGGLINNVPADVLIQCGCNFVIASSVTAQLESEFAANRADTPTSQMKTPSTMQTVLRCYLVQSVNMNSIGVQPADVVIEPNVTHVDLSDFSKTKEMAQEGERAALEAIPRIKSLLTQIDGQLFPQPEVT